MTKKQEEYAFCSASGKNYLDLMKKALTERKKCGIVSLADEQQSSWRVG